VWTRRIVQAASLQKLLKAEMRARIRIAHTLHLEKLPYGVPLEKICRAAAPNLLRPESISAIKCWS
jgi:hypothetical protein